MKSESDIRKMIDVVRERRDASDNITETAACEAVILTLYAVLDEGSVNG
jgi:hypothetical protein